MPRGRPTKPEAIKALTGKSHKTTKKTTKTTEKTAEICDYEAIPQPKMLWENLSRCGVVQMSDRLTFLRYESIYRKYMDAERDIKERGMILHKGATNECYNPSWRISRDCAEQLLKIEREFGLTPASKRGVTQPLSAAAKPAEEEDWYDKTRREQWEDRHTSGGKQR